MKKELETLIQAVRIYSDNIWMEFNIEKYATLIMKSRKQQMMEGIEQPNQEKNLNARRKGHLQVFGNSRSEHH